MTADQYITNLERALQSARARYFPMDRDGRKRQLLSLAREVGYGLAAWDDEEIDKVVPSTYGRLVVRNSFDSVGPTINNNEGTCNPEGDCDRRHDW